MPLPIQQPRHPAIKPLAHRVAAKSGSRYQVIDDQTGLSSPSMVIKRRGDRLVVEVDGERCLELTNFFREGSLVGTAYFDIPQANGETISLTQTSMPVSAAVNGEYPMYPPLGSDGGVFAWLSKAVGLIVLAWQRFARLVASWWAADRGLRRKR